MLACTFSLFSQNDSNGLDNFVIFVCSLNFVFSAFQNLNVLNKVVIYYIQDFSTRIFCTKIVRTLEESGNIHYLSRVENFAYFYTKDLTKSIFSYNSPSAREFKARYCILSLLIALVAMVEIFIGKSLSWGILNLYVCAPLFFLGNYMLNRYISLKLCISELTENPNTIIEYLKRYYEQ